MPSSRGRVVRVSLQGLFPAATFSVPGEAWVQSCSIDAHRCRPGDLYVAVDNGQRDGHDLIQTAVGRGAAAVLGERLAPVTVPQCIVPDSREALARICHALGGYPTERLTTIGVSGTHGKTTVQWLLASILEQAGLLTGVWGSLGRFDGEVADPRPVDVASARSLVGWLNRSYRHGARHAIVEAGSSHLAAKTMTGLELDVAVVTNCLRDHIREHGTWENYVSAKERIFGQLKAQGTVVLNSNDAVSRRWLKQLDVPVLTFGLQDSSNVYGQVLEMSAGHQSMLLHLGAETVAVESRMMGDHVLQNCLAAAAAALALGIPATKIARGLESMDSIPGRLERLSGPGGPAIYVDEARTPHALALMLSTLRRVTRGRLLVVYGGGHLTSDERPRLGRVAERFADVTVLSSRRLDRKAPLRRLHDLLDGYARPARAHVMPDRAKAICWTLSEAGPGDAVLLVGSQRLQPGRKAARLRDADVVKAWQEAFDSASGPSWAAA